MMKKAFTLIELLVVVSIMGLMGTISVGGYRQFQRGMEERGVMQNVNQFLRNAFERAQIDRAPTEVYFWNETIQAKSDYENEIVVGRAVAVRRCGRISQVRNDLLIDEFGDLEQYDADGLYQTERKDNDAKIRLYQLEGDSVGAAYSIVYGTPCTFNGESATYPSVYVTHNPALDANNKMLFKRGVLQFGYRIADPGNAKWANGVAYGLEFLSLQLPPGYIFGSSYSSDVTQPNKDVDKLIYRPGVNGQGVQVSCIRPGNGGALSAQKLASATAPTLR